MELTSEQVKHIADLARLKLTEEEIETYKNQLSNVLGYIDQLSEVDTINVSVDLDHRDYDQFSRKDIVNDWDEQERKKALIQAAQFEDEQIMVKKIL